MRNLVVKLIVRIEKDLADIVTIEVICYQNSLNIFYLAKKHGRQGARLITDLIFVPRSHPIMHFICFSTLILNIAKSLQHIGLFNTVTIKSHVSDYRVILTLLLIICY